MARLPTSLPRLRAPTVCMAGGPAAPGAPRDYKVALITGANTGIGYQTALALARKDHYVVLGCRNAAKAEAACDRIKEVGASGVTARYPCPSVRPLTAAVHSPGLQGGGAGVPRR